MLTLSNIAGEGHVKSIKQDEARVGRSYRSICLFRRIILQLHIMFTQRAYAHYIMHPPKDERVSKTIALEEIIPLFSRRSDILDTLLGSRGIYHQMGDADVKSLSEQILEGR